MRIDTVFDTPKPCFSDEIVHVLLETQYNLQGSLHILNSERDQNFRVDTPKGRYVLKIANSAEDPQLLDMQSATLQHLAKTAPELGIPRLIPTRNGLTTCMLASGESVYQVRLLSYLPGQMYSSIKPNAALVYSLGKFIGKLSKGMQGFGHRAAYRDGFLWNMDEVGLRRQWLGDVAPQHRVMIEHIFDRYDQHVAPKLSRLRAAVLHQDANDNNVVITDSPSPHVSGLIDFGDMCFGRQINELAVTLAYALLDVDDIYDTAKALIRGYCEQFPITEDEATVLFDLAAVRLAASVCVSSHRSKLRQDNSYLLISQAPALRLLKRLENVSKKFLSAFARHAAGFAATTNHSMIVNWLNSDQCQPHSLFDIDLHRSNRILVSYAKDADGMQYVADPRAHWQWLQRCMQNEQASYALGMYGEERDTSVYNGEQFATSASPERRCKHLGIDVFIAAGSKLYAPLDGEVVSIIDNALSFDYGPTLILCHQAGKQGRSFYTLYGHLSRQTLSMFKAGQKVVAGQCIGTIGDSDINGGWSPHLHFQIIVDLLGMHGDFPGAGQPSLWPVWQQLCPDPNLLLKLVPERFIEDHTPPQVLLTRRSNLLGPSLSVSYQKKLKIVRGRGAYLYDHTGRAYVDAVNNICHVGHSHPHVAQALAKQAALLNTNTRYLHDKILDYVERLGEKFPKLLSVVYLVCSGSEANELALRMARTITGRQHTICLDWGYHGNTNSTIEISPYKFNRKGGHGQAAHIQIAALPDPYRGKYKGYSEQTGIVYAQSVGEKIEMIREKTGYGPAAFIAEAVSGCGGQVFFPDGYLKSAAQQVRAAGGMVIIDEVQTGFGRVGDHFWAHGTQQITPDIVTLGKPIGNGHPMAAVVTTPEIAKAFANGMEFFSSFGGNPVSCAVGMAVLDVIENEKLQQNALTTGNYLIEKLTKLIDRYPLVGDVRGRGLFIGIELVRDRNTLEPATHEANRIINHMRELGVLVSTDGPYDNVLKIKPPLVFGIKEADALLESLESALQTV